jgi:hypothetical protein
VLVYPDAAQLAVIFDKVNGRQGNDIVAAPFYSETGYEHLDVADYAFDGHGPLPLADSDALSDADPLSRAKVTIMDNSHADSWQQAGCRRESCRVYLRSKLKPGQHSGPARSVQCRELG